MKNTNIQSDIQSDIQAHQDRMEQQMFLMGYTGNDMEPSSFLQGYSEPVGQIFSDAFRK